MTTPLSTSHTTCTSSKLIMKLPSYQDFKNLTRTRIETEIEQMELINPQVNHHSSYSLKRNMVSITFQSAQHLINHYF